MRGTRWQRPHPGGTAGRNVRHKPSAAGHCGHCRPRPTGRPPLPSARPTPAPHPLPRGLEPHTAIPTAQYHHTETDRQTDGWTDGRTGTDPPHALPPARPAPPPALALPTAPRVGSAARPRPGPAGLAQPPAPRSEGSPRERSPNRAAVALTVRGAAAPASASALPTANRPLRHDGMRALRLRRGRPARGGRAREPKAGPSAGPISGCGRPLPRKAARGGAARSPQVEAGRRSARGDAEARSREVAEPGGRRRRRQKVARAVAVPP